MVCGYMQATLMRQLQSRRPWGGALGQGIKPELPFVTLVFSAVDGLKAMRVCLIIWGL